LLIFTTEPRTHGLLGGAHRALDDLVEQHLPSRLELVGEQDTGIALHLLAAHLGLREDPLALRLGLLAHLRADALDLLIDALELALVVRELVFRLALHGRGGADAPLDPLLARREPRSDRRAAEAHQQPDQDDGVEHHRADRRGRPRGAPKQVRLDAFPLSEQAVKPAHVLEARHVMPFVGLVAMRLRGGREDGAGQHHQQGRGRAQGSSQLPHSTDLHWLTSRPSTWRAMSFARAPDCFSSSARIPWSSAAILARPSSRICVEACCASSRMLASSLAVSERTLSRSSAATTRIFASSFS